MRKSSFKNWLKQEQLKNKIIRIGNILSQALSVDIQAGAMSVSSGTNEGYESRQLKAHSITEKYWLEPELSQLHSWLASHGIEWSSNKLPKFKEGGSGRAYFVNDHVVKFTANKIEANVAYMASKYKSSPTPIIDVLPLGSTMYAILQHHVDMNVSKDIRDAADYITAIVDDHPDMEGFPSDRKTQEQLSRAVLADYGGDIKLLPYMMTVLTALHGLYRITGFKHDDAGPTNVGMQQDKVVFPDLGPNETGDFDPDKAMEKISQSRRKLDLPPWKEI